MLQCSFQMLYVPKKQTKQNYFYEGYTPVSSYSSYDNPTFPLGEFERLDTQNIFLCTVFGSLPGGWRSKEMETEIRQMRWALRNQDAETISKRYVYFVAPVIP